MLALLCARLRLANLVAAVRRAVGQIRAVLKVGQVETAVDMEIRLDLVRRLGTAADLLRTDKATVLLRMAKDTEIQDLAANLKSLKLSK